MTTTTGTGATDGHPVASLRERTERAIAELEAFAVDPELSDAQRARVCRGLLPEAHQLLADIDAA